MESLVDVAVQNKDGTTYIVTSDSTLLPWHFRDDFLEQLFQLANEEDVLPLSSFGTWNGEDPGSDTMMLLPLYHAWLVNDAHDHNALE